REDEAATVLEEHSPRFARQQEGKRLGDRCGLGRRSASTRSVLICGLGWGLRERRLGSGSRRADRALDGRGRSSRSGPTARDSSQGHPSAGPGIAPAAIYHGPSLTNPQSLLLGWIFSSIIQIRESLASSGCSWESQVEPISSLE